MFHFNQLQGEGVQGHLSQTVKECTTNATPIMIWHERLYTHSWPGPDMMTLCTTHALIWHSNTLKRTMKTIYLVGSNT